MSYTRKIILVNPSVTKVRGVSFIVSESYQYMYPYSLIFLYNYLKKNGCDCKLFDLYIVSVEELINYCRNLKFPIIGITSQTYSSITAINCIKRIKKVNPTSTIVVGGKHFGYCDEDALNNISEIDIVVRGEGEVTFYELCNALLKKKELDEIDGITYRKDNEVIRNKERDLIKNIEEVSLDYSILPNINSFAKGIYIRNFEKEKIKSLPVYLSRGCPEKCVFCNYNKFKYRTRKIENILNEILYLKENFDNHYFTFSDPSFCGRKAFATEFCNMLIKNNFNIRWSCEARVDTPFELLELMAKAGCISLDFGLESGSDKVLKAIKKKIDVGRVLDFAQNCQRLNIRTHVFIMVSLPEEMEEDAYKTLNIAKELSRICNSMSIAAAQIYPGTELEEIAKEKGILPPDFSYHDNRFFHSNTDFCDKNVPLYIENLSLCFIRKFIMEMDVVKNVEYDTFYDFIMKSFSGIRKMHSMSLSENVRNISRFFQVLRAKCKTKIK